MTADHPLWKRGLDLLHDLEDALMALLLLGMLGLAITQIILRELLHSGVPWIDPLLRIAVLWLGLLGALLATRLDRHIEINLISHWVSPGIILWIRRALALFATLVCAILAWQGGRFVLDEYHFASTTLADLPAWPFESIIPIAFGLMALRYLLKLFISIPEDKRSA